MKPLTRVAAWVFMGMAVWGMGMAVEWQLRPPAQVAAWLSSPAFGLSADALMLAAALLSGVALVRGKAWGWWVVVVWSAARLFGWLCYLDLSSAAGRGAWPAWVLWNGHVESCLRALSLAALVLDPPWRWAGPERARYKLQEGVLRPPTAAIAWAWLGAGALSVSASAISLSFWPSWTAGFRAEMMDMMAALAGAGVVLIVAAAALLRRRAWGWTALVISLALLIAIGLLSLVGVILDRLLSGPAPTPAHVMPGLFDPAALTLFAGLSLWGLRADPPRRWRRVESAPPATDTGETPEPPAS